jgi:hypothetical protein
MCREHVWFCVCLHFTVVRTTPHMLCGPPGTGEVMMDYVQVAADAACLYP